MLVAAAVAGVIWVTNPFAAALLIPALHIWLFALAPELRMPRGGASRWPRSVSCPS